MEYRKRSLSEVEHNNMDLYCALSVLFVMLYIMYYSTIST